MKRIITIIMALAASQAYGAGEKATTPEAKWEAECGSCHIAYPARFLTAETWQRLMGNLDRHFGDNASLDPATTRDITDYLTRNASTRPNHGSNSMRISEAPWFGRTHHEVSNRAWTDPRVKSAANCTACHIEADSGDWSERGVRMPSGLGGEEEDEDDD